MNFKVTPENVCPSLISFDLDGEVVSNVEFTRGCNGNLKAIAKLVDGMTVTEIEKLLKGNVCGNRGTSCADQFAIAIRSKYEEQNA